MPRYRNQLPQLGDALFLTDGGIETTLIFQEGLELPLFAAFTLLAGDEGAQTLRKYYRGYAEIARSRGAGLVLESATWRASPDWATQLGVSAAQLDALNRRSVELMAELRAELADASIPVVLSGCVGPRGDGYRPEALMSTEQAETYHGTQIQSFRETEADMICAITMTHCGEAIGVARAAQRAGMPVALSFTVETDGRLPSGQPLREAIEMTDADAQSHVDYYMVNCAHPSHFLGQLETGARWLERIGGIRANASRMSHAELDAAAELDSGDPAELAQDYRELQRRLPRLRVLGGCCGTDPRHIEAIAAACVG